MIDIYVKFQTVYGSTIFGFMHPEPVAVSVDEAKSAMDQIQKSISKKQIGFLALFDRSSSTIAEITVPSGFIEVSAMSVRIIETP